MRQSIGRFLVGLILVTGVGASAGLAAVLVAPGVAGATSPLVVNDALDGTATPGNCTSSTVTTGPDCTLRAALAEATLMAADVTITVPDAALVEFNPSTSHIYQVLSPNELDVSDSGHTVTINGAGDSSSILQAQCTGTCSGPVTNRVLEVENGTTAVISDVTIEDGDPSAGVGGGILNDGILTLGASQVSDNTAADSGGGIEASDGASTTLTSDYISGNTQSATSEQGGGGIFVEGESEEASLLDISDSTTVVNNVADGGDGGGIALGGSGNVNTVATIDTASIYTNATDTNGGGIAQDADSTLTVTNSAFGGNTATFDGGGVLLEGDSSAVDSFSNDIFGGPAPDGEPNTAVSGGGVYIGGVDPTFTDDTITHNAVSGDGGGVYIGGGSNTFTGNGTNISSNTATVNGGGVYIGFGTNSFTDGTIDSNTASDGGGFYVEDGTNTFSGNTISQNQVSGDGGGGVYISNGESCSNSFSGDTVAENQSTAADSDGGGFYIDGCSNTFSDETIGGASSADANTVSGSDAGGGGVYINSGTNSFTNGSISNNLLTGDYTYGGGVYIGAGTNTFTGVSVTSNQAQNGGNGGGVYIDTGGTNTFANTAVDSNQADWTEAQGGGLGGGFYYEDGINTFSGGSIDSNQAYEGGGAYLGYGTETFTQADISSNTATESAAGLWISVDDIADPTTITSSTISQNNVPGLVGATPFLGDGGGILADSCDGDNQINLTNDTIAGNSATLLGGGYYGTGDCVVQAGTAGPAAATPHVTPHVAAVPVTNFLFDTIDANSSGGEGGNVNTDDSSVLNAAETIIADGMSDDTPGTNCTFTGAGTVTSGGYNLISDITCGTAASTDIINPHAQLGALGNNGGPTNTELPASTSPAVGAVPAAVCTGTGITTDQRGNARGAGLNGSCTIGAVEVAVAAPPAVNLNGYRLVANEGGIFDFGLNFDGSLANNHLNAPIIGIANSPGYDGYVMAGGDGGVFALGGANFYGSLGGQAIPSPISAIAAPPSENGYWLVAQNGKIYNFGAVPALPAVQLPSGAHIVGMASTTDGQGAWLTDQLGDVYAEGDALYKGGLGGVHINSPIVGLAAAASGQGYVLVATDGGVFNYGTQGFFGSVPGSLAPGQHLVAPIVGIAVTHSGNGYWEVGSDGGVFNYGDAPFLGSIYTAIGNHPLNGPVVGIQHLGEPSA